MVKLLNMSATTAGRRHDFQSNGHKSNGHVQHIGNYSQPTGNNKATDNFSFRKRAEKIDWRMIGAADVTRIAKTLDYQSLQDNIVNVTFCDIEQELELQSIDPNYVKLFQLAQLIIEYLLHSQEYVIGKLQESQTTLSRVSEEFGVSRSALESCQSELTEVKAESHKRKKIIAAQQKIIQNGNDAYHKCGHCEKAFMSQSFLDAHLTKRHPGITSVQNNTADQSKENTRPSDTMTVRLHDELDAVREQLRLTETRLDEEKRSRLNIEKNQRTAAFAEKARQREMETWQEEQRKTHREEMDDLTERLMREVREANEKRRVVEEALIVLQKQSGRRSQVGLVQEDIDVVELRRQREELAVLREQLLSQKDNSIKMEDMLQSKLQQQETKWKTKIDDINKQHRQEMSKLEEFASADNGRSSVKQSPVKGTAQIHAAKRKLFQDAVAETVSNQPSLTAPNSNVAPTRDDDDEFSLSDGEIDDETTFGNPTLASVGSGTLSVAENRKDQLLAELDQNPGLLQSCKERVLTQLQAALERRGIPANTEGIDNARYSTVVNGLKTERTKTAKEIRNFWDIRNQTANTVETQARQLAGEGRKGGGDRSSVVGQRSLLRGVSNASSTQQNKPILNPTSNTRQSITTTGHSTGTGQSYTTGTSYTSYTTSSQSTSFESGDDEPSEKYRQVELKKARPKTPTINLPSPDHSAADNSALHSAATSNDNDSEWDDDISELEEAIKPPTSTVQSKASTLQVPATAYKARVVQSKPLEQPVRTSDQPRRPAASSSPSPSPRRDDNDLSILSMSSWEEPTPRQAPPTAKAPAPRSAGAEPAFSSTSMFGGTKPGTATGGGKKLRNSVTFSDDLESTGSFND